MLSTTKEETLTQPGDSTGSSDCDPVSIKPDNSIKVAVLLTVAGGFLDAFTYVGHGGVFANSMTGNLFSSVCSLLR